MARAGRQSFEKRQREIKKKEKRQEKLNRRAERKNETTDPSDMILSVNPIQEFLMNDKNNV
ncbi:MAG: hypothetical protein OEZ34_05185 [Spirochaetia bacterium]|nr:hypothetical protein [Spirochaetia bacterium]